MSMPAQLAQPAPSEAKAFRIAIKPLTRYLIMVKFCSALLIFALGELLASATIVLKEDGYQVQPGDSIQEAIELAAGNKTNKTVYVHAGTYRPSTPGQAFIFLNHKHDGVQLKAQGNVTLNAANPEVARAGSRGFPAIVNHIVYFGDGISRRTVFDGFKLTGAKGYFTTNATEQIEPNRLLERGLFFYGDGGAMKVFGRSYPTIRNVECHDNYASPCAGGLSIQHEGHGNQTSPQAVLVENCIFRNNSAEVNAAAVDLLPGSVATLTNCLFVGNYGNVGRNYIDDRPQPEFTNAAPLCVFQAAFALVLNCTFTGNRNAVHDLSETGSTYRNCVFWNNSIPGGFYTTNRFEFFAEGEPEVSACFFKGVVIDPKRRLNSSNVFQAPDPDFDEVFNPRNPLYRNAGYRVTVK
jgi:hypothetical protein